MQLSYLLAHWPKTEILWWVGQRIVPCHTLNILHYNSIHPFERWPAFQEPNQASCLLHHTIHIHPCWLSLVYCCNSPWSWDITQSPYAIHDQGGIWREICLLKVYQPNWSSCCNNKEGWQLYVFCFEWLSMLFQHYDIATGSKLVLGGKTPGQAFPMLNNNAAKACLIKTEKKMVFPHG